MLLAVCWNVASDLQKFIQRARQVTRLTELTPEIVHVFIAQIVVSRPEKIDGKRHQRVEIHYYTIGLWVAPELETEAQEKDGVAEATPSK